MVGDEDQSIYAFRAAYPKALLEFNKVYNNSKILLMETNYRSTPEILRVANDFIKQNKNRKDKNILPFRESGENIKKVTVNTIDEQYEYIIKQAKANKDKMAILYRNNDSAIPIVNLLNKHNIDYTIKETDSNFFSNNIVKDIKCFINFYLQPTNMEIFKKIYYKINCGITKEQINLLSDYIKRRNNKNILDNLIKMDEIVYWQRKKLKQINLEMLLWRRRNSLEIIKSIFKTLEYEKYLKKKTDKNNNYQKINIMYSLGSQISNIQQFLAKLDELEVNLKQGIKNDPNLTLSTIHGSKGLEYDRVILIDINEGILPSIEKPKDEKMKDIEIYEEEVRVFYVAITRAKNKLDILTYKTAYGEQVKESCFLDQIFKKQD